MLKNQPLSDPFLQVLSMSPQTFSAGKNALQSYSANSTATSTMPNKVSHSKQSQAASQDFVPQTQTVGFGEPK